MCLCHLPFLAQYISAWIIPLFLRSLALSQLQVWFQMVVVGGIVAVGSPVSLLASDEIRNHKKLFLGK